MTSETKLKPQEVSKKPPENKPFVTGLIVTFLMILSLFLGVVAGPMLSTWYVDNFQEKENKMSSEDHFDHDHTIAGKDQGEASSWYVCPMHPWVVQPGEGLCPICVMDLVPLDPERFSNEIVIDPVILQNIGVRVAEVKTGIPEKSIRISGTVAFDERRTFDLNIKSGGWIEKLYVDFEGAEIKKGQKLLDLYSPDLLVTQKDLIMLLAEPERNKELIRIAKSRLQLFDIDIEQIEEIVRTGKVRRTFSFHSPISGYLMDKSVDSGSQVRPGQRAFRIWDGSHVWIKAFVSEAQLPHVKKGQKVAVSFTHSPGGETLGTISYISPEFDLKTREAEVRIDLRNRKGRFKPGMYADVEIHSGSGAEEVVMAPSESVINTGQREIAFVSLGNGKFEPRDVTSGNHISGGMLEILTGLTPGESVVVSGQFLLDSESKIRESLLKMIQGNQASKQLPVREFAGVAKITLSAASKNIMDDVFETYLIISEDFYNGSLVNVKKNIAGYIKAFESLNQEINSETEILIDVLKSAREISTSNDLHVSRVAFGYIGEGLDSLLKMTGNQEVAGEKVLGVRCGMFNEAPGGGIWLQQGGKIRNPFYGKNSVMASCSSEKWEYSRSETEEESPEIAKPEQVAAREIPAEGQEDYSRALAAYLEMQNLLYLNRTDGIKEQALLIMQSLQESTSDTSSKIHDLATAIDSSDDIKVIRRNFGAMGIVLDELFKKIGAPSQYSGKLVGKKCGMYPDAPESGIWIQLEGETENPFFGHKHEMARCAPRQWQYPDTGKQND